MKAIKLLCAVCAAMLLLSVVLLLLQRISYEAQVITLKVNKQTDAVKEVGDKKIKIDFVVEEEMQQPYFSMQLKYNSYPMTFAYLVCDEGTNIRTLPSKDGKILRETGKWEKLQYIETIKIYNDQNQEEEDGSTEEQWYHVYWYENKVKEIVPDGSGLIKQSDKEIMVKRSFGFVNAEAVSKRYFDFNQMEEKIIQLETESNEGDITYVSNYKNYYGLPPLWNGKEIDEEGTPRSQSVPAYSNESKDSKFIYVPDGTLVKCLKRTNGFWHVMLVQDGKKYFIPEKYILKEKSLQSLTKIIVIDRKNQNICSFEKIKGAWELVSYSLVTTGTKNKYAQPTPLGFYFVIEKKPQFYYLKDGTNEIQGYAPYTLRFCGGAYLHGVSVAYQWQNGKRIDPGLREYASSIGTVPLSHKCVRNYTSHAKFLYDWYTKDETVVAVIEP